jgi:hypothetical protein
VLLQVLKELKVLMVLKEIKGLKVQYKELKVLKET